MCAQSSCMLSQLQKRSAWQGVLLGTTVVSSSQLTQLRGIYYCIVTKHLRLGPTTCGGIQARALRLILLFVTNVSRALIVFNVQQSLTSLKELISRRYKSEGIHTRRAPHKKRDYYRSSSENSIFVSKTPKRNEIHIEFERKLDEMWYFCLV